MKDKPKVQFSTHSTSTIYIGCPNYFFSFANCEFITIMLSHKFHSHIKVKA